MPILTVLPEAAADSKAHIVDIPSHQAAAADITAGAAAILSLDDNLEEINKVIRVVGGCASGLKK